MYDFFFILTESYDTYLLAVFESEADCLMRSEGYRICGNFLPIHPQPEPVVRKNGACESSALSTNGQDSKKTNLKCRKHCKVPTFAGPVRELLKLRDTVTGIRGQIL